VFKRLDDHGVPLENYGIIKKIVAFDLPQCHASCRWFPGISRSYPPPVKSLSPNHRFVIALHSPDGVLETGLRVCPPEKKAVKLGYAVQRDTFSGPV